MSKFTSAIGSLVLLGVCAVLGAMILGWVVMWTIETAHEVWWPVIPEIGYWNAVRLGLPLAVLGSLLFGRSRSTKN
ncbi:hypothetical protein AB0L00_22905 [Actinoallomurus sp. NPDC052308]|uniref:hypothetical protein n=1 Tax=Actinoallomurus sp. NPDC052308 TaxID=3155530 RepID=UPI003428CC60